MSAHTSPTDYRINKQMQMMKSTASVGNCSADHRGYQRRRLTTALA